MKSCEIYSDYNTLPLVCEFMLESNRPLNKTFLAAFQELFSKIRLPEIVWRLLIRITRRIVAARATETQLLFPYEGLVTHLLETNQEASAAIRDWSNDLVTAMRNRSWGAPQMVQRGQRKGVELVKALYSVLPKMISDVSEETKKFMFNAFLQSAKEYRLKRVDLPDSGAFLYELLETVGLYSSFVYQYIWHQAGSKSMLGHQLKMLLVADLYFAEFLRTDPQWVVENIVEIISYFVTKGSWSNYPARIFKSPHLVVFYGLTEKISQTCEKLFEEKKGNEVVIFKIYARVATLEKFVQLAKPFIVSGARVDKRLENASLILQIPSLFRYLRPLEDTLPYILPCLVGGGDLLYPALFTFWTYCYNAPVEEARKVALPYLQAPVSVMKKAVRVIFDVCTIDEALQLLRAEWERSKHYSAKTALLSCISTIFLDVPGPDTWATLRQCLLESNSIVVPAENIPDDYLAEFVATVWTALTTLPLNNKPDEKEPFVNSIASRIPLLDDQICRKIIEPSLFTAASQVDLFASNYLLHGSVPLQARLSFVKDLFVERMGGNSKAITAFMATFYREASFVQHRTVVTAFSTTFKAYFDRVELFSARLQLEYLELMVTPDGGVSLSLLPNVGNAIAELWLKTCDYSLLRPLLERSISSTFAFDDKIHALLVGLIRPDPVICLAALKLLPHNKYSFDSLEAPPNASEIPWDGDESDVIHSCHQFVIGAIGQVNDLTVQFHLKRYLMDDVEELNEE